MIPTHVPISANDIDIAIISPTLLVRYLAALAGTVRRTNINSAPTTGTVILVATDSKTRKKIEINFPFNPNARAPIASKESNLIFL